MGCCTSIQKSKTLRKDSIVSINEAKGKDTFKGKEVKEVLKDMIIEDMLIAVKT
jgi:hypothetical protein